MAKGVKIDNSKIVEVMTSYALTKSYNATAKVCGVSANSVKNIINRDENKEEFAKICKEKKELFSEKANRIIDKSLELLERRFNTALDNENIIDELISIILNDDSADEKMSYQEKLSIAKRLGKLQINSLSEITTSMGTLYDKMRLAKGETTENTKQVIIVQMSPEVEELSK